MCTAFFSYNFCCCLDANVFAVANQLWRVVCNCVIFFHCYCSVLIDILYSTVGITSYIFCFYYLFIYLFILGFSNLSILPLWHVVWCTCDARALLLLVSCWCSGGWCSCRAYLVFWWCLCDAHGHAVLGLYSWLYSARAHLVLVWCWWSCRAYVVIVWMPRSCCACVVLVIVSRTCCNRLNSAFVLCSCCVSNRVVYVLWSFEFCVRVVPAWC